MAPRRARRSPFAFVAFAVALVLPLAVAAAWIPVRDRLPNTDLALILVAVVAGVGLFGRRVPVLAAAVTAALWFEFFDTRPYDQLAIARNPDVETTVVLVVVAVMAGELAIWTTRHLRGLHIEHEQLRSVREAAELVASGEELARVVQAVGVELKHLLSLEDCAFEAPDLAAPPREVTRDGHLPPPPPVPETPYLAYLGIVVQGEELGRYVLRFRAGSQPAPDALLVAVTLADQVGAAFLAQAPPPMPPNGFEPMRGLRVVRGSEHAGANEARRGAHETAGLSSTRDRMIS